MAAALPGMTALNVLWLGGNGFSGEVQQALKAAAQHVKGDKSDFHT